MKWLLFGTLVALVATVALSSPAGSRQEPPEVIISFTSKFEYMCIKRNFTAECCIVRECEKHSERASFEPRRSLSDL